MLDELIQCDAGQTDCSKEELGSVRTTILSHLSHHVSLVFHQTHWEKYTLSALSLVWSTGSVGYFWLSQRKFVSQLVRQVKQKLLTGHWSCCGCWSLHFPSRNRVQQVALGSIKVCLWSLGQAGLPYQGNIISRQEIGFSRSLWSLVTGHGRAVDADLFISRREMNWVSAGHSG